MLYIKHLIKLKTMIAFKKKENKKGTTFWGYYLP